MLLLVCSLCNLCSFLVCSLCNLCSFLLCVYGSNCVFWFSDCTLSSSKLSTLDCRLSLLLCSFTEKLPAGDQRLLHGPGTESPLCQSTNPQVQGLWVFRTVQRFSGRSVNEMQLLISEAWKLTLFMNLYDLCFVLFLPCFFFTAWESMFCVRGPSARESTLSVSKSKQTIPLLQLHEC